MLESFTWFFHNAIDFAISLQLIQSDSIRINEKIAFNYEEHITIEWNEGKSKKNAPKGCTIPQSLASGVIYFNSMALLDWKLKKRLKLFYYFFYVIGSIFYVSFRMWTSTRLIRLQLVSFDVPEKSTIPRHHNMIDVYGYEHGYRSQWKLWMDEMEEFW